MTQDILARFRGDTANHAMEVLHDDGLYRHLRFRRQVWEPPLAKPRTTGMYWFDLVTIPGALIFQGDGQSFIFRRLTDMFEFFRRQHVNPSYWAEKLACGSEVMEYSAEEFVTQVADMFVDAARYGGVPAGTGRALLDEVLNDDVIHDEREAHRALADFEHKGFRFYDTWEYSFRSYNWWFLWALHAIVWGIAQYDAHQTGTEPQDVLAKYGLRPPRRVQINLSRRRTGQRRRLVATPVPSLPRVVTVTATGGVL